MFMKDGICPKCNSEEVYFDGTGRHGIDLKISYSYVHGTHLYICADCGYIEFYAQTGFDLQKVKEKYQRVKK